MGLGRALGGALGRPRQPLLAASLSWPPGPAVNLSPSDLPLTGLCTAAVSRGPAREGRAWASTQNSSSGRRSHVGREGSPGLRGEPHGDTAWGTRIQGAPLQLGVCPGRPGSNSRCVCTSVPSSVHWAPGQGLCCPRGTRTRTWSHSACPADAGTAQSSDGEGLPSPPFPGPPAPLPLVTVGTPIGTTVPSLRLSG